MNLSPNQIFHGRYQLIELLGSGASAQVWKAYDKKAGNLVVALKIYTSDPALQGTRGLQIFQKEFTTVFNMTHTNLLRPSGYDINEGCPYLTMQYCENGSTTCMVGRMNEEELLHFIHDVAAGLEYLHDHNIIHQDIKPDNVLVDDNCNFLLTDFGISKKENNAESPIGGTRAYMAPEVYSGKTTKESDIWSLGATAVELLTGQPPFGENGGLAEAQGSEMEKLPPKLQPQVKAMLKSMLEENPSKRPTASELRRKIELYHETGSWTRKSNRDMWIYLASAVASIGIFVAIFFFDYHRVKVEYYKDYAEVWGVPTGIGKVSSGEQKHRNNTIKFEKQKGKVRRVSTVNSNGRLAPFSESELKDRYIDAEFFYNNDGAIDYVKVYDQNGKCLYKLDYDANLRTAVFKEDDEFGTEKTLSLNTTDTYNNDENMHSNISRYKLTYDEKGRVTKREYAGFQNVDVVDEDMVHGMLYTYDDKNRIIETAFIGLDGEVRGNKKGLAIKQREYDDNDNFVKISYLTADRTPSHDGNNVGVVTFEPDKYGNTLTELYFDHEGNPVIRRDELVHGHKYEYDDNGHRVKSIFIGTDGNPSFTQTGYMAELMTYDENGYLTSISYLDDNDLPVNINNNISFATISFLNDPRGNVLELTRVDKNGDPVESTAGVWRTVYSYDSLGNILGEKYFDKDDAATKFDGYQSSTEIIYDKFNRQIEKAYFDENHNPVLNNGGFHKLTIEYTPQGNVAQYRYFGTDGKPVKNTERYARLAFDYDEKGNIVAQKYFDENDAPVLNSYGYAVIKFYYDPKTNFETGLGTFDTKGKHLSGRKFAHDAKGNLTELRYTDENGNVASGTVIENYEYNDLNLKTREFYTDANGNAATFPGERYSVVKFEYDDHGNAVNTSYWDKDGQPSYNSSKTHIIIKNYDAMDNLVYWKDLDVDGKPNKTNENWAEVKYAYDNRGNMTELMIFDGFGNPVNGDDGWHKKSSTYNNRNQALTVEYRNVSGNLAKSKEQDYAREVNEYDNHGNLIRSEEYDQDNKLKLVATWTFNNKDKMTELVYKDADGNYPKDSLARSVLEYEDDEMTPKKQSWYWDDNTLYAYRTYDKEAGEWNDYVFPNSYSSSSYSQTSSGNSYSLGKSSGYGATSSSWKSELYELAYDCPQTFTDNMTLQSVNVGTSSVTVTLKLRFISKYELDADDERTLAELKSDIKSYFRDNYNIPSSVSVYVNMQDKAGRSI